MSIWLQSPCLQPQNWLMIMDRQYSCKLWTQLTTPFSWPKSHARHIRVKRTVGYIVFEDAKNYCPAFPCLRWPENILDVVHSLLRVAVIWPPGGSSPALSESQNDTQHNATHLLCLHQLPGTWTHTEDTQVSSACYFSLIQNCIVRINSCRDWPVHD